MSQVRSIEINNNATAPTLLTPPIPTIDITSPAFHANPHPFYRLLRDQAPVHRVLLPTKLHAWLVTRYDDVSTVLRDERFVKSPTNVMALPGQPPVKTPWMPGFLRPLSNNMLDLDGADHARLRALVHHAFTPKLIEQMRQKIDTVVNQLLDKALAAGRVDLVQDFALPLPVAIIADMLGVPTHERNQFDKWSRQMIDTTTNLEMLLNIPNMWRFLRYIRHLIALRRVDPQDDLITALLHAQEADDALSDDEVVAMVFLLLVAGHETTVTLISGSVLALLQQPEQLRQLQQDPNLIKSAVEELARYVTPVSLSTERYAREDVTIAGTTIPRGSLTFAVLSSANHDERRFDQPEWLNLQRQNNQHFAFGQGAHYCMGAPLARMETHIAINTLLARAPNLQLAVAPDQLRWRKSQIIRGLTALPVSM